MRPEDKVTLELSGRQLAKIYAVFGRTNGSFLSSIWEDVKDILDPNQSLYDSFHFPENITNYYLYEDEWEKHLFGGKSDVFIRIAALEQELKKLKEEFA